MRILSSGIAGTPFAFGVGGLAPILPMALLLVGRSPGGAVAWVLAFLVVALLVASGGVQSLFFFPRPRASRSACRRLE
ncbi:MAG: hypothetical protein SPH79_03880 [Schaalia hyovaginalis]|uniref:hypothetical protein n=1 Tax=Schaalia hyovaginalis TaxID=29316 RepID=UPI002A90DA1A|nr:hypothetical protein [Schaalia hyovaginalis]MDY6213610.1 hypothetical protein [Schaalia hyovaginalis]